jgi:hypothetical protein
VSWADARARAEAQLAQVAARTQPRLAEINALARRFPD